MCGLVGIVGPESVGPGKWVEKMTHALRHRGPDDMGTWASSLSVGDVPFEIAVGHTRLSIIDLSALGRQPMATPRGDVLIAYNGEIYNYRELRAELTAAGYSFLSQTDTEVALVAYLHWGTSAFAKFVGMFAIAIWDGRSDTLILVRDRMGIKPLVYQPGTGTLVFGSELSALRCCSLFKDEIDPAALGLFLRYGYVPSPMTIYQGAFKLPPGHFLRWKAGSISLHQYWNLFERDYEVPEAFHEAVNGLETLLRGAVQSRLIADVPVGAFLSGGIDSSVVVALMQQASSKPVKTFTVGFSDPRYDESARARAVAARLGTDHVELHVDRHSALAAIRDLAGVFDEPFADESAVPVLLVSRLARRHVKVALTGDGGDELFGGYSRYRRLALLERLFAIPAPVRRTLAGLGKRSPHRGLRAFATLLGAHDIALAGSVITARFPRQLIEKAVGEDSAPEFDAYLGAFRSAPSSSASRRAMFADAHTYLADDILVKLDRTSMSVGLEGRVPLLDHRVVRYALSLAVEGAMGSRRTKAPLRAIAERLLPAPLVGRSKQGFGFPLHSLLGAEIAAWTKKYLAPARVREEGNLNAEAVGEMVAATDVRSRVAIKGLWNLLCFQRWFAAIHRGEDVFSDSAAPLLDA